MKTNRKWIVAGLIVIVMVLLVISAIGVSQTVNNPALESVVPMQRVINRMGTAIGGWTNSLGEWSTLKEQNEALQLELAQKDAELQEAEAVMESQPYLAAAWQAKQENNRIVIEARVISKSKGIWFQTFVIDQGSDAGIQPNDTVVTGIIDEGEFGAYGLIGQVSEVGKGYAVVQTLANKETNIAFEILRTGDQGILEGDLDTVHEGFLFNTEANVATGDDLITTGISDYYLPGILIGEVTSIQKEGDQLVKHLQVETLVDFQKIKSVFIIREAEHE
jgi:rod shape-determining protein MreC